MIDRRQHLGRASAALILSTALILAACTANQAPAAAPGSSATAAPKKDVILKYGVDLASPIGIGILDPARATHGVQEFLHLHLIYDSLLRPGKDGTWKPGLATGWKIVDLRTITLDLRQGVTFTDGTPFNAEAVKFGLERNRDAKNTSFSLDLAALAGVDVSAPYQLTLHLNKDIAGSFLEVLGGREGAIVSPTAAQNGTDLMKQPVGAGPFQVERVVPDQLISLRKRANTWDAAEWQYAGIDLVNSADGPPRLNGLLAGEYDLAEFTDPQTSEALQDNKSYAVKYFGSDGNFLYFRGCITKPPFDDKRVRQALRYAVDREAINQTLFGGRGEAMTGLWPKSSPFHNEAVDSLSVYDPERAKALLAEAGFPNGISFDVVYAADQKAQQRLNEIFQGSAAKAGMTVQLVPSNNIIQDAFVNPRAPVIGVNNQRPGLSKITRPFGTGSISNMCNYHNDALDQVTAQIAALSSDDPAVIPLWKRADQLIADDAIMSYAVFQAWVMAWNSNKVSGVDFIYGPYMGPEFQTIRVQ